MYLILTNLDDVSICNIALTFANAGCDVILHYNERRDGALSTYGEINRRYRRYKRDVGSSSSSSSSSSSRTTSSPGMCLGVVCADFRDSRSVDAMFDAVVEGISRGKEGFRDAHPRRRLDVLVNNAGIVTKLAMEDDDDETLASYHETMAVNLHAPLRLMRRAHRHMKGSGGGGGGGGGGGVIINNTSVHGTRSVEYMTSYAASKAALESLTRGLAIEYAPDGVRVNAIAPGVVPVERTASMFSDRNVVDMWTPRIPLGRLGTVEDVAHATLLLATNEWMTGTVLTLDGGMMARANMPIRPRPAIPHPTPPPSQPRSKVPAGGGESGGYDDRLDSCRPEKGSSLRDVLFEVPSAT
ncbi:hypothetical protein ACHAXA_001349 [Cyclostephanos tholiformis]|uniref:Uncharacterized protein n=1 Tax=Cyclostephanos tholiformis TaxID=382380 RepID=A0ABD3R753_9STRA